MTDVSIALATYNGERFLERQLESLAWQTQIPAELVVTDDCSTDRTVDIMRKFAIQAPFPVRIVINERTLNYRANFLKAAGLCTSEIIMFCDQDDIWRPDKVASIADAFSKDSDASLVYHAATIVDASEQAIGHMFNSAEELAILSRDLPPPWFFARGLVQGFRRELLAFDDLWPKACEHFDSGRLGHDRWYFFLALAFGQVRFLDKDLLMYRQHGNNAYGADKKRGLLDKILARLEHHAESDILGAAGARSRVEVLRALYDRCPKALHGRIERLSQAYEEHASRLERRAHVFGDPSMLARLKALAQSIRHRDYCGNPWGFDPRSIVRDIASGVIGLGR